MGKINENKKWVKKRHLIVKRLLIKPFELYTQKTYHLKATIYDNSAHRQFFILTNHQTPFDQFFTGFVFRDPIYYVATEDIFSIGLLSRLLEFAVAPIPFRKGSSSDMNSIRAMVQVAKEGGSIAICPEGNRTYSGVTETIKPSIAKMIKLLKLPVMLMRFEGGFGADPRWGAKRRKGEVRAYVSRIIEPEEYKGMSNEEFAELISRELYVDDTAFDGTYESARRAEYIERLLYYCPNCGFSEFESSKNHAHCKKCGMGFTYMPDLTLKGDADGFKFKYLKDWYRAQEDFIKSVNPADYGADDILYEDTVRLFRVIVYKHKKRIDMQARLTMTGEGLTISGRKADMQLRFEDIESMSILGHNKIGFYSGGQLYQIKGNPRFNAVKYTNYYYHYMNVRNGEKNDEFLGL